MYKVIVALLIMLTWISASPSLAWDVSYEGNVLPNSSALGTSTWVAVPFGNTLAGSSADGDVLHLVDSSDFICCFAREAAGIPAGTPFTIEARMKILAFDSGGGRDVGLTLGMCTMSHGVSIGLFPDKVRMQYQGGDETPIFIPVDMSQFHTFRLAMQGGGDARFDIWMDGATFFSGVSVSGGATPGVGVGGWGLPMAATSDSYWDYVRYSTEYIPVPEPSALMTLAGGLGTLALPLMRRKRRR